MFVCVYLCVSFAIYVFVCLTVSICDSVCMSVSVYVNITGDLWKVFVVVIFSDILERLQKYLNGIPTSILEETTWMSLDCVDEGLRSRNLILTVLTEAANVTENRPI